MSMKVSRGVTEGRSSMNAARNATDATRTNNLHTDSSVGVGRSSRRPRSMSLAGIGSKGLAMSRRSKLRAWMVALVAALAVVVGGIGVAFAAAGDVPPHSKNIANNGDGVDAGRL